MKGSFEVHSVEETWQLAAELARELKPGDVLCLEGDLGAGKTTFTQGLAHALGVPGRVTSPTFCIVQEHAGEKTLLVHMDLYRPRARRKPHSGLGPACGLPPFGGRNPPGLH